MNILHKSGIAAIMLFTFPAIANAQEELPALEQRVSKLEKAVSYLPRIETVINMRYQYHNQQGHYNSFDIRRARIDLKGDAGQKIDYRLHVEFANSPKILDAQIRFKLNRYFNVQAGQFKIPFSIENRYSPQTLETIDNSMIISYLCAYSDVSGINANGRDIGLNLYGGFLHRDGYNIIDYAVGIFNGNGINRTDNNNSKDITGTLSVNPIRSLSFVFSHYNGCTGPSGETYQRVRFGGGAKYDDGKLMVRSEYIRGKTGQLKSDGVYAVTAYTFCNKVQPVLKFDYYRLDVDNNDTKMIDYTAGINYTPVKYIKLQLNYSRKTRNASKDYNYVAAQVFGLF